MSVWVEILLDKFASYRPTQRLLEQWQLLGLDLAAGTVTDGLQRLEPLFQPILESKSLSVNWFGAVLAAMTIFEALGAARPHRVRRAFGPVGAVFGLTITMALCLGFIVPLGSLGTVVLLCVFAVATGISFPVQKQLLNDSIPDSRYRATLLSMESILDRAVCALVAVALGAYLAGGRLDEFLVLSAVVTCVVMGLLGLLLLAVRRHRSDRRVTLPA